jgi:hypothetical protein
MTPGPWCAASGRSVELLATSRQEEEGHGYPYSEGTREHIPPLGAASGQEDPVVWVKLTCEQAGWTWYIIEMQPLQQDAIFYGYRVGWDEEVTYFNQSDLELQGAQWGFPIVRDAAFTPCRLPDVQATERGARKFPLGQLVATPAGPPRASTRLICSRHKRCSESSQRKAENPITSPIM